ncbi:polycystic kidney disease protein 1-like 2 [Hyla sarda]|uniref:polycystic kidney disease protein 1-like 2 n=1 Tax=Hyla sarda TaxID=327740 RepID=UPI0024C2C6A7|nr:polycystic kidney disease protein 1-like 2 [Hyla sarda]
MDFLDASRSCLACGGHLANVSDGVLAFLAQQLNESSSSWVKHDALANNSTLLLILCPVVTHNAEVQFASCLQQNGFICQTEGSSCNMEQLQEVTRYTVQRHVKSTIFARRRKRSAESNVNVQDILEMALQLSNTTTVAEHNITDILIPLSYLMQDEVEANKTQLVDTLSLLNQLSDQLRTQDINSLSTLFANLSNVVYYGINSILQSILSSCSEISWTLSERQSITNSALDVVNKLQLTTLSNLSHQLSLQTPMFSILLSSVNTSEINKYFLSCPNPMAAVIFPSQTALPSVLQSLPSVQVQMMSFVENPFRMDSSFNISGTVASLTVLKKSQELSLHNLSDYFQIFLSRTESSQSQPTPIQISTDKALQLSLKVTPSESTLVIIISVNHNVKLELYHGLKLITKSQITIQSVLDFYTWILTPDMISDPTAPQLFLVSPSNTNGIQNLQLTVSAFTVQCAFWNSDLQKWSSDGCIVGSQTTLTKVHCMCNHLSVFGSSFLILPVQIDVTRTAEYFSKISENPVIVVLVACFYFCYIITVLWARRMDLRDQMQNRVIVPCDSDTCGLYRYLATVCTGHRRGAGTSAKVWLSLCGTKSQFGPILLSDTKHQVFRSGNVDVFILSVPFPLGEIKSITLNHDGTGPHKSWYVTQVTIQDVQLKMSWHFLCNTWLSKLPKGGSLSKTFKVANDQELRSFRNIFLKKTLRGLRDEHIWISILNHPARSVFTRVQRVSCCMCLLLCTIVINLMFWELPQSTYPVLISVGSFTLTWKDIIIAFESAIFMFPINLLIIYIFRNTQPKEIKNTNTKIKKGKKVLKAKKSSPCQLSISTVLEDLSGVVKILSEVSQNKVEMDLDQESNKNVTVLLQTISHLLQEQLTPGLLSSSVSLMQLSSDELHALFCAHYVSRKLKKVSQDLQQLENQQAQDKTQHDVFLTQLHPLLHVLDKSVPPLPAQRSQQKQQVQKKRLPWWFLFIGWTLLISISIVSTYFTMMYGFLYGKESSIRWIISMTLSLFQSIFILQPLKVVGFAIFFALILKKVDEDEELVDTELGISDEYRTSDETAL